MPSAGGAGAGGSAAGVISPPPIDPKNGLRDTKFIEAFQDHGPDKLRPVLAKMPLHVVTFEMCALHAAANYARRL